MSPHHTQPTTPRPPLHTHLPNNTRITEITVLPHGMNENDEEIDIFSVAVRWQGPRTETGQGGYAIIHANKHLSKEGGWRWRPEPHLQHHYRWETLEETLTIAQHIVNDLKVNGATWAQWEERRKKEPDLDTLNN